MQVKYHNSLISRKFILFNKEHRKVYIRKQSSKDYGPAVSVVSIKPTERPPGLPSELYSVDFIQYSYVVFSLFLYLYFVKIFVFCPLIRGKRSSLLLHILCSYCRVEFQQLVSLYVNPTVKKHLCILGYHSHCSASI